jgi:copper(I)-binding protein
MSRLPFVALAFAALLLAPRLALAGQAAMGNITVEGAWSRATPGGAEVAAGYLTIVNHSDVADRLVSASTAIAGKTEIHQMKMSDGKMEMRPLPDGIEIPAKGTVALEPMGYHLMLMQLKHPLEKGETFAGSLTFEHAGTIDVTFNVEGIGASGPTAP